MGSVLLIACVLAGVQLTRAGTLKSEWSSCQGNLLLNPELAWSNGTVQSWDIYPAGAANPLAQGILGPLVEDSKGFRISGVQQDGSVDFYAVTQTVGLNSAIPSGGQHFVLAVQATFTLPESGCGSPCRAGISLVACSGMECSSAQILASDYRAAGLSGLEGYQILHPSPENPEWHLLEVLAPSGTTHFRVELEALLADGSVEARTACLRQVPSFDAVTWLMDRYYSHFPYATGLDWAAAVSAARPNIVGVVPPLSEAASLEVLKSLLAQTKDVHVYIRDSSGQVILPVDDAPALNIDPALLPTAEGALQFPDAGNSVLKTTTLSAARNGSEPREGTYLYALVPSMVGGTGPDWSALIEEVHRRFSEVQGAILDLRANVGGAELRAESLTALLTPVDFPYKQVRYRAGAAHAAFSSPLAVSARTSANLFSGSFATYTGPVAVLLGPGCVSSCEGWAAMLQALADTPRGRIRSFGAATRGASGNPTAVPMSGGAQVVFSTWDALSLGGAPLEGAGIAPDEEVPWPSEAEGQADPVLAAAVQWLAFEQGAYAVAPDTPAPESGGPRRATQALSRTWAGVGLAVAAWLCVAVP